MNDSQKVDWPRIRYFKPQEFDSPDQRGSGRVNMKAAFVNRLDAARNIAAIRFRITSGYRTEAHNKRIGGAADSAHTRGYAADIAVRDNQEREIILNALIRAGFRRIGIAKTFIHADDDPTLPTSRVWLYD